MALDTSIYKVIEDAPTIVSDAASKMIEVAIAAIDSEGSPRQPRLQDQLIELGVYYEQVLAHITITIGVVTAIVGDNVETVNSLLIRLKRVTEINL